MITALTILVWIVVGLAAFYLAFAVFAAIIIGITAVLGKNKSGGKKGRRP